MGGIRTITSRKTGRAASRAAARSAVIALSLAIFAAGCTSSDAPSATPTPPASAPAPTPAPTPPAAYPAQRVEFIVPWAAGGGTDRMARMLAPFIGEELGVRLTVVNRVGGAGVVGHTAISTGTSNGSVLGLATTELTMSHHLGLTELTYLDVEPVATLGANWSSVIVRADSPFKTIADLLDYVRANPGKLTASGTSVGGIWHVGMMGMLIEAGLPADSIKWVPSEGGAPALQELLAGGIDLSFASLPENSSQLDAGGVRALAIMADERDGNFPDVPTLKEQGIDWTLTAPFFVVAPKGTPVEVLEQLEAAMARVAESSLFREIQANNLFGAVWWDRAETLERLKWADDTMGALLREAGVAAG